MKQMPCACRVLLLSLFFALRCANSPAAGPDSLSLENYPAFPPEAELRRLSDLYRQARDLQLARDYEGAATALEALAGADWPFELDTVSFKLNLAQAYSQAGLGDRAAELLVQLENTATVRSPLYPEIHYQLSAAILAGGNVEEGILRFRYLAENFASSRAGQQALLALAQAYRDAGDLEQAWMYYDRYLVTYQGRRVRHAILLEAADMYFEAQNPQRAAELTMRVWREIHRYPDSGPSGLRMLMTLRRNGLLDAALVIAGDLCASDRDQAQEGCFRLGELLEATGDPVAARNAYRKTLHDFPLTRFTVRAYRAKGGVTGTRDPLPALPEHVRADRRNEHWPSLMTEVARMATARGYHREALAALKDVPNTNDRLSAQRARLVLNAARALAEEEPDRNCEWLGVAVGVRPLVADHKAAVRAWLEACAPEYSESHMAAFRDLSSNAGKRSVEVANELIRAWGTEHRSLQNLLLSLWDAPIISSDRLVLAPDLLHMQLARRDQRWEHDLWLIESDVWHELESEFPQTLYVRVFDLLAEYGHMDRAIDWLLTFAAYARGPGMARMNKALSHLFDKRDNDRYDTLSEWYAHWYPGAKDLPRVAARQVEIRMAGADLGDAWACAQKWLARFDRPEALDFIGRIMPFFANRGSHYVEALSAYILLGAQNEEESIAAHRQLGDYYLRMMDYEKATAHLGEAFRLSSTLSDQDKMKLGTSLLKAVGEAGYPEEYVRHLFAGLRTIMDGIQDSALRSQAGNRLAKGLERLGYLEEAHQLYREVYEQNPENTSAQTALYNLAKSYATADMDEQAIAVYMEYLDRYDSEDDQRWYNIALANALSIAMKETDPGLLGELQTKVEAMINGVNDPFTLLDLAQYFGREGHENVSDLLREKGVREITAGIETAGSPDEMFKLLNHAIKRMTKMGFADWAAELGQPYVELALSDKKESQPESLYKAQYEYFRSLLKVRPRDNVELTELGMKLAEKAREHGYADTEANLLYALTKTAKSSVRWALREDLAIRHGKNMNALEAKIMVAAKAYHENDLDKASRLAFDALNQAADPYFADYADKHRYNAIYLAATIMKEKGGGGDYETLFREVDNYAEKERGLYVKTIMDGSKLMQ